jgi:hypothetical protein
MKNNSDSRKRLIKIVIAGLIAVGIPVITSVGIATPAAAMAAPVLTCAQGGTCIVGDTGPGGGIVFYVAPSVFTETGTACATACKYLEAAPISGINAWTDARYPWNPGMVASLVGASGQAIGTGFDNTKKLTEYYGSQGAYGAQASRDYRGPNNLSDWFLPSMDELGQMIANSTALQMAGYSEQYLSSSEVVFNFMIVWSVGGQYESANKENGAYVRPIRAFAAVAVPSFTISSSSETSVAGMPISGYTIDVTGGGAITSYSISPAINNGLSFDTATGLISGTPIAARSSKAYTITGNNTVGMDSKTFTISVGTRVWSEYFTGSKMWSSIVTSSDGTKFAAAQSNGPIWLSSDAGVTFVQREMAQMEALEDWKSLASSSDLTILHGVSNLNFVYNSNDFGLTWDRVAGPGAAGIPVQITSSSDGTKVVLVYQNGLIYTSSDSGATWVVRTNSNQNWTSIASSSDGNKLVAGDSGGSIWTSSDSGTSWTAEGVPLRNWKAVASNSDGTKLVAVNSGANEDNNGDYIWTSSDSGLSWTQQQGSGIKRWKSIASSSDGTKLAALVADDRIQTSRDSGVTWSDGGIYGGESIASNSDGNVLATVKNADYIWTSRIVVPVPSAAPSFSILSSSESATVGRPITGYTINATGGGAIDSYSISPAISNGLSFDTATGLISGTPNTVASTIVYTITADNDTGLATQTFTLTVSPTCAAGGPCVVGDRGPGGGIVYYVSASNFTSTGSTCNTACEYLEVAPAGWNNGAVVANDPLLVWSSNTSLTTGQDTVTAGTESAFADEKFNWKIGQGFYNTSVMKVAGETSTAQAAVLSYAGSSTAGQWFIPSMNELNELCKYARGQTTGELAVACTSGGTLKTGTADDLGGFVENFYWSSSEIGEVYAAGQLFHNGLQGNILKSSARYVRPVRAFGQILAPVFTLTASFEMASVGTPITGFTIQSTGGSISSFSIVPAPPVWFQFNTTTGALTGSPSDYLAPTEYTIRGTNDSGYLEQKFVIRVLDTFVGNVGTPFSLPDEGRGGTPPFVYMANGMLPAGLNLNDSSGLISGIPLEMETRQVCIFITDSLNVQVSQCIAIAILASLPPPNAGGGGGGGGGGAGGGVTPPAAPVPPVSAPVETSTATATPSAAPVQTSTATVTPSAAPVQTSTATVTPLAATMETSTATVGGKSTIVPMIVKAKVHLVLTFTGKISQLSASHLKLLKKLSKQLRTTKVKIAGLRSPTKSGNEYLIAQKRSRAVVKALKKLEPSSGVIATPYYSAVPDACRQSSSKVKRQCVVIFSTGK